MRLFIFSMLAIIILGGCSAKEFNDGVSDGIDDVKRVVR